MSSVKYYVAICAHLAVLKKACIFNVNVSGCSDVTVSSRKLDQK